MRITNTPQFRRFCVIAKFLRFPENGPREVVPIRFDAHLFVVESEFIKVGRRGMGQVGHGRGGRSAQLQASCEACFFHENQLCAVSGSGPCATFRPAGPDGLRPPSQLRFVFRQERRRQVAWAFPSANEQVSLHA